MQSYRRGDFLFDTGFHYVGGLEKGQSLHGIFSHLGLLGLPWRRMDDHFDHIILGGCEFCMTSGYEAFEGSLSQLFPHQREGLRAYVHKLRHVGYDDIEVNAWAYLHDLFDDERLISLLCASSLKIELRKESLPLFSLAHSCRSYIESSWRLKGSSSLIVEQLERAIRCNGGTIVTGCEVVRLCGDGTCVSHVVCADGRELEAGCVIADIHPHILAEITDMSPDGKGRLFARRMKEQQNTYGMFTASLLLKPNTVRYRNHNAFVYDSPDVWTLPDDDDAIHRVMVSSRHPEDGSGYARQIDLLTPMTWSQCREWADTTVGHRGPDYVAMCQAKAAQCIRLASRFIPCLDSAVEACYTCTPLTYRDYLMAPEGNAFGTRKDCRKSIFTFHSVRTPLSNLLLTGQSVWLPGVEGVAMTALETCRQLLGDDYIRTVSRL